MSTGIHVVLFSAASADDISRIGRVLVEERLAACVNVIPSIRSIYRWEGKLQEQSEAMGLAKTREERVEELVSRVRALHGYLVPEVLVLPVEGGNPVYLKWVAEST